MSVNEALPFVLEYAMHPLNIYIHIPFCHSKCPYCGFFSCTNCDDQYAAYFESLNKEIVQRAVEYKNREIETIYIGGGTPNLVPPQYISNVLKNIQNNFNIASKAEITIELYPQYINEEAINEYKTAGINRVSMGLQTTNDQQLHKLTRRYTYEEFLQKLNLIKKIGFDNIGIDLIFGYPEHTLNQWQETLDLIASLDIQHISCYSLEIEEHTPYYNLYQADQLSLPTEEENREMYHYAYQYLRKKNFDQYEISNFSKKGYECRHNLNFWHYQDYIGIGAGAYSRVGNTKFNNPENLATYISGVYEIKKEYMTEEAIKKEQLILALRLNEGVPYDKSTFSKEYMYIKENKMILNEQGKDLYNLVVEGIL